MIAITDRAIEKVKQYSAEMPEAEGRDLRLFIQGVGCSGFAYGFTFDERRDGDTVVDAGELTILVDARSGEHMSGSTVDFVDDHRGAGFIVDNPNAPPAQDDRSSGGCCGCG